ncbi:hypothetical protein [Pseudoalteromonas sp. S185]|uniref:hypothetical protein n=1 Tax=Pseudoalteromonas sp. S185 TaxID=2066522 RepID=UPI0014873433|nr:hypothetical protein [Pseudoalteromonas sp. S185]
MITAADKFWNADLILSANGIRARYGIDFRRDQQAANDLVSGIAAAFVWLVPNKEREK